MHAASSLPEFVRVTTGSERPRTYVVTGAMSGIGAATTQLLRRGGHRVVSVDIAAGADVRVCLSSPDAVSDLELGLAGRDITTADAVIACAGVVGAGVTPRTVLQVNYYGVLATLAAVRPLLLRSPAARAAVVSSFAATMNPHAELLRALEVDDRESALALCDAPGNGGLVYATGKRALNYWLRSAAVSDEWAGAGITLNAVAPGTVRTPMMADALADPVRRRAVDEMIPMALAHCDPSDIARALAWLSSEDNFKITGQRRFQRIRDCRDLIY